MAYKKLAPRKKKPKKSKKSRNKSTRANANPLSAQGSSSSAETAAAPAVASPSVDNTAAAPVANTAAAPVANTAAAPAPAQRLYVRCSFQEYLKNPYQLDGEQLKREGQSILSSLAGKLDLLESKSITHGHLRHENIFVSGNGAKNLKVEIQGIPQKNNLALPSLREEFRTLASEVTDTWGAICPLVLAHFFKKIEDCIPWSQLQWHRLLLSSDELGFVVYRLYTHLDIERKGWKGNYRKLTKGEKVDLSVISRGTYRAAFAFTKVEGYKFVNYKPNALGALMFFRNAFVHVNRHIKTELKRKNKKQEEIEKELLTIEERVNTLERLFPKVPLQLFDYMLREGIDINTTIT